MHITRHPNGHVNWAVMFDTALDMRRSGMTNDEIAAVFGTSATTISNTLALHGEKYNPELKKGRLGCDGVAAEPEVVAPRRCSACRAVFERRSRFLFRCEPCKRAA